MSKFDREYYKDLFISVLKESIPGFYLDLSRGVMRISNNTQQHKIEVHRKVYIPHDSCKLVKFNNFSYCSGYKQVEQINGIYYVPFDIGIDFFYTDEPISSKDSPSARP